MSTRFDERAPTPAPCPQPIIGIHDETQMMSRSMEPSPAAPLMSGPIDPAAATAAFGHYADDAPRRSTTKPHIPICDRDVSCPPHERTIGESAKIGVGKLWSKIERALGPSEPAEPGRAIGGPRG